MSKYRLLFLMLTIIMIIYMYFNKLSCSYPLITIKTFENINIRYCSKDTLITFDIDDTLIMAQDALARLDKFPFIFTIMALYRYPPLINQKTWEHITSIIFDQAARKLTDRYIVTLINSLKKKSCKVIGLTSMETGSWGIIKNMPEWRSTMLKSMGINLKGQFPNQIFDQFSVTYRGKYPEIYEGIICANQQPKGKVLGYFIDLQKNKPKLIISFDDEQNALCSIAQACQERGIEFIGYHYIGARSHAKKFILQRALLQLDFLFNKHKWLTDEKADALLQPIHTTI